MTAPQDPTDEHATHNERARTAGETMTKRAVLRTYRGFLDQLTDEMLAVVKAEFGGGLLGSVASVGVGKVTGRIQDEMEEQGRLVVEYAAALADGDDGKPYERKFLRTNPVYRRYDGPDEAELERHLIEHFRQIGTDLAPLVASEEDDFWLAMREEYDREAAMALIDRHFGQAETFKRFGDGVFSSATLGKRVVGVVDEGERRLRADLHAELDQAYDEA